MARRSRVQAAGGDARYAGYAPRHIRGGRLQLLGRAFSEATLVALGTAYQQVTDWHRKRPPA